ncbi:MAG: recombination regulator RecX [Propionibacteriaceae bacterium]|jgi:regulatory protein|nr:recombination regulator RecX [Propionibacteriaceae bacterium]
MLTQPPVKLSSEPAAATAPVDWRRQTQIADLRQLISQIPSRAEETAPSEAGAGGMSQASAKASVQPIVAAAPVGDRQSGGVRHLDPDDIAGATLDQVAVDQARDVALRRLTTRARSQAELEADLSRRGFDRSIVQLVIARLAAVGLVDDLAFARAWVEQRQAAKAIGWRRLAQELALKGVDRTIVDQVRLELAGDDSAEFAAARSLAARRAATMKGLDQATVERRLAGQLARRGYSSDIIRQVIASLRNDDSVDDELGNMHVDE